MNLKQVFGRLFFGYLVVGMILGIPAMVLNFFGKVPIMFNDKPYYGFWGILIPLIYIPFFSVISAFLNSLLFLFGNRILTRFNKNNSSI